MAEGISRRWGILGGTPQQNFETTNGCSSAGTQQPAEAAGESPTTQELKLEMGKQLDRLLTLPEGDFRGRARLWGKCCQKDRELEGRVAEAMTQEIEQYNSQPRSLTVRLFY